MRSHIWQRVLRRFTDSPSVSDGVPRTGTDDKSSDGASTTPASSTTSPPPTPDPDITARQLRKFFIHHPRRLAKLPLSEVELVEKYVKSLPAVPPERLIPASTSKRFKASEPKPYIQSWITDQSSLRDDLTSIVRHIRTQKAKALDSQSHHSEPATCTPHPPPQALFDELPLDYGSSEIRLLRIRPGHDTEPLKTEMFKVELDSDPLFDALSYAWASENSDASISVNGHAVGIGESLHQALLQLRHPSEDTDMWIDALCTNQTSADEKNHQVFMMQDIYSLASTDVIWLGNPPAHFDLVNECIADLKKASAEDSHQTSALGRHLEKSILSPTSFDTALIELFSNSWFSQTWAVQEAALASRDPIFYYGQHRFSWNSLGLLHSALSSYYASAWQMWYPDRNPHIYHGELHDAFDTSNFDKIYHLRQEVQRRGIHRLQLDEVLFLSQDQYASDSMDHIYGLFSLVPPEDRARIDADESKPSGSHSK